MTRGEGDWLRSVLTPLLARSVPRAVVLPRCPFEHDSTHAMGFWEAIGKVKKALAAAGVGVEAGE